MAPDPAPHLGSPSTAAPVLAVDGITYAYLGRFPALDDVSFSIERGERVALVGPNGGGKSTMLKILDGLVFPDAGTFEAFGQPVTEDTLEDDQFNEAFRSRVGFVFQNTDAQVFSPTVRDEVAFGPLNMGLSSAEASMRVDDTLALLGITALADRAPYQLSGGQKKRVAIASVLAMNPEVLLFDEPTAALDPKSRGQVVDFLIGWGRTAKTVITATHDLDIVEDIADYCFVFQNGRITGAGTPAEILADTALLERTNLIHAHRHAHSNGEIHSHPHSHRLHEHENKS